MNKSKDNKKVKQEKVHRKLDKGQVFVKVMAGFLAFLMLLAASASLIYTLLG